MNIGADRRHFLVVIIVLAVLAFPNACTGRTGFAPQTEEAVFHFVGGNQEVEHNWPWGGIFCSYDLTVGCSLTSDMYGFRTYSVNSVTFVTQLYYVFQLPGECPVCETYYVFFGSEDFDLGAEASKVQLFAKGTFVNPTDEDIYTLWLTLKQNKTFNTPKGATVTYECDGGNELLIGTADSTYAYSENGAFWGHLTLPYEPPNDLSLEFGTMITQDTPTAVRYLDADLFDGVASAHATDGVVAGAAADGASRVVVEVTGCETEPVATIPEGGGAWEDSTWQQYAYKTWRRVWKAPRDFYTLGSEYAELASRLIDFGFVLDGKAVHAPPLVLVKPPVLLLHGLFATRENTWRAMVEALKTGYAGGDALLVSAMDYDNDAHFSANIKKIKELVSSTLERAREQRLETGDANVFGRIVAKKADIVAHSMGGILANLYVADGIYAGDVNRIITIETPHSGSELANFVLHFLYCEMNPAQVAFWHPALGPLILWLQLYFTVGAGGVTDLQVGSDAITGYRESLSLMNEEVPVFPVVGEHYEDHAPDSPLSYVYGFFATMDFLFNSGDPYFPGGMYDLRNVEAGLFPSGQNSSDFVVSVESQSGGLSGPQYEPTPVKDHVNTTGDASVIARVIDLLNSPVSSFADRFSPPVDYPAAPVGPVTPPDCGTGAGTTPQLVSGSGEGRTSQSVSGSGAGTAQDGALRITLPADGAVFAPGDTVGIEVAYSGQPHPKVIFMSASGDSASDTLAPYEFSLVIDESYAGPMGILAAAINGQWESADSLLDQAVIHVVPTDPVESLYILPEGPLYLTVEQTCRLYVEGVCPDSIARDITSGVTGTQYSSSDSSVAAVGQDGLITALSPGETLLRVQNGAAREFYVIVDADTTVGMSFAGAAAAAEGGCIVLSWQMGVEAPASSFRVERSEYASGPFFVLGLPVSRQSTHSFSCTDCSVASGTEYWYRIVYSGMDGEEVYGPIEASVPSTPAGFKLHQSYPNPFNPSCTVRYEVLKAGPVSLRIYDVSGAAVRTLVSRVLKPGVYNAAWDGRSDDGTPMASGVYFCRLEAGEFTATRKTVLLR